MHIEINTDNHIKGTAAFAEAVGALMQSRLARIADRLTRLEVHLSDVNGPRGGPDKRCVLEARPSAMDPITVTADGASEEQAAAAAADKLLAAFNRTAGRRTTRKGH